MGSGLELSVFLWRLADQTENPRGGGSIPPPAIPFVRTWNLVWEEDQKLLICGRNIHRMHSSGKSIVQLGLVHFKVPTKTIQWETNRLPSTSVQSRIAQSINVPLFHNLIFLRVCPCESLH